MKLSSAIMTYTLIAGTAVPSLAQGLISLGYNSFNEVYLGTEFPRAASKQASLQVGYQFALTSSANYTWGPFDMTTPFTTNNAEGIRARMGYQLVVDSKSIATIFLEYQKLESNEFLYSNFSGSRFASATKFTEDYDKIGLRLMNAVPIAKSESAFLTFSIALFYSMNTRYYSVVGSYASPTPSSAVEKSTSFVPQLTIGLKFLMF